jgi:hypothetical protein
VFKTLVLFRADYERGIWIDAEITVNWGEAVDKAQAVQDLEHCTDDPKKKAEIRALMPKEINNLMYAAKTMTLRGLFNHDVRGPYLIDCEHHPTDEELLAWAEVNVYKTDKPAKPFRGM